MGHGRIAEASQRVSWLLRHGASSVGIPMDAAGWAPIADVLRATGLSRATLDEVIQQNTKKRFELSGGQIRACQGHSRSGTPVTAEALEASWQLYEDRAAMFHGTRVGTVASIAREGILPGERTHVHMAPTLDSQVGKRANVNVVLEVCPARVREEGLTIYRSSNGVLLCRRVPVRCIIGIVTQSRTAKQAEARLRAALALAPAEGEGSGKTI